MSRKLTLEWEPSTDERHLKAKKDTSELESGVIIVLKGEPLYF